MRSPFFTWISRTIESQFYSSCSSSTVESADYPSPRASTNRVSRASKSSARSPLGSLYCLQAPSSKAQTTTSPFEEMTTSWAWILGLISRQSVGNLPMAVFESRGTWLLSPFWGYSQNRLHSLLNYLRIALTPGTTCYSCIYRLLTEMLGNSQSASLQISLRRSSPSLSGVYSCSGISRAWPVRWRSESKKSLKCQRQQRRWSMRKALSRLRSRGCRLRLALEESPSASCSGWTLQMHLANQASKLWTSVLAQMRTNMNYSHRAQSCLVLRTRPLRTSLRRPMVQQRGSTAQLARHSRLRKIRWTTLVPDSSRMSNRLPKMTVRDQSNLDSTFTSESYVLKHLATSGLLTPSSSRSSSCRFAALPRGSLAYIRSSSRLTFMKYFLRSQAVPLSRAVIEFQKKAVSQLMQSWRVSVRIIWSFFTIILERSYLSSARMLKDWCYYCTTTSRVRWPSEHEIAWQLPYCQS